MLQFTGMTSRWSKATIVPELVKFIDKSSNTDSSFVCFCILKSDNEPQSITYNQVILYNEQGPIQRKYFHQQYQNLQWITYYATIIKNELFLTFANWALRSFTSASKIRFSPKAVEREASLALKRASRSLSLPRAASRSDSFLAFLQRQKMSYSVRFCYKQLSQMHSMGLCLQSE